MPYPKDHKAKTRERILEAARVLFNRHGYDRVTIDQIMAAANLVWSPVSDAALRAIDIAPAARQ